MDLDRIDLGKIITVQMEMDSRFQQTPDMHMKNCLWMFTELAELANEWGGFKYRHRQQEMDRERLLGEYVDALAVLLSLGLFHNYFPLPEVMNAPAAYYKDRSTVRQFMRLISGTWQLYEWQMTPREYTHHLRRFLALGDMLGLKPEEVEEAYMAKQWTNLKRVNRGE